ncbi:MAG: sodium/proline symporter [Oligoflexales bacterium]
MPSTITVTFCIYLSFTLGIGFYSYWKTVTVKDYLLADKKLGPFTSALSAGASDMSGWLLLGLPGLAFSGHSGCLWVALSLLLGTYANWKIIAKPLREATQNNIQTLPRYLEVRFNTKHGFLRVLSASLIIFFFTLYASSGLIAAGKLFEQGFQIPSYTGIFITAFLMVTYTIFGGFLAIVWTDVFQALLMSLALIVVPISIFWQTWDATHVVMNHKLSIFEVISHASWGLGYFGQPHILSRFMAMKDTKNISKSAQFGTIWCGACLLGAVCTGFAGFRFFNGQLSDPESVFMALIQEAFPPFIAGTLLAAIFGAIISTADSQLLVAASSLIQDLFPSNSKIGRQVCSSIHYGRAAIVLITATATLIAIHHSHLVLEVVAFAWAGFGATLGPVILCSLYWKKTNEISAICGLLSGTTALIMCKWFQSPIYELLPGFFTALFTILIISSLSHQKNCDT